MKKIIISLADTPMEICCDETLQKFFKNYTAQGLPAVSLNLKDQTPLAAHEAVSEVLPLYNAALFHASAISAGGQGVLFTAPSGTGKSTHAAFWKQCFDDVRYVNDDKPFLAVKDNELRVWGSPWRGKHSRGENISVPVKRICLLERGEETRAERIAFPEAYPRLLAQIYRPEDPAAMKKTLELLDCLAGVPIYILRCTLQPSSAEIARKELEL